MVNRLSTLETSLSQQIIRLKPGGPAATFEVVVVNGSEQFATFLLDIDAPGADPTTDYRWYQLSPEIATKKPPGDRTVFRVSIINNPVPGFVGTMNLTVRIFSLELQEEERQIVRLVVEQGIEAAPLELTLPVQIFSLHPGATIEIPVELHNPSQVPVEATLQCHGLPADWVIAQPEKLPKVNPGTEAETFLQCQVPPMAQVPSQGYPFTVTALQPNGLSSSAQGTIQILPDGYLEARYEPTEQDIPGADGEAQTATFMVAVENASNLFEQISLEVPQTTLPPEAVVSLGTAVARPGETAHLELEVAPKRPWLGPPRRHVLDVMTRVANPQLDVRNDSQTLTLWVKPRISFLLQLAGGMLLALLLLLPFLLRPSGHTGPVSDLEVSGDADRIVSGSSDQTLRRWRIEGDHLKPNGVLGKLDKAVRVVRLRPVNNNVVAVGLENGEISLWDVLSNRKKPLQTLVDDKANRVLSLEFTPDANYLFSSHGSGAVLQWAVGQELSGSASRSRPVRDKEFDFAVYDLARIGEQGSQLAIAGRYNRLVLWNWQNDVTHNLGDQRGSQNDYIQSLAVPDFRPYRLAVADNQGRIRLWDLSQCVPEARANCEELLEDWRGHGDRPVRAIAFSANGCYLASVGDDRRVMLWPLGADGRRTPRWQNGQSVLKRQQKLNAVGVVLTDDQILVSSGGDDHQVRLNVLNRTQLQQDPGTCDAR
ncbi:MAG TPA: hypothetical protein V6D29_02695 [Leptolyngbyaceae cyanobacterium]